MGQWLEPALLLFSYLLLRLSYVKYVLIKVGVVSFEFLGVDKLQSLGWS